uniref:Uncharacterized protein n=1 Tax=Mus musculus TaxID=10090 RepID=Q8BW14_MOUSE|nr:unnamed protein product [Mus musculus]
MVTTILFPVSEFEYPKCLVYVDSLLCACTCVCVCVCVCERERESVCVCVCASSAEYHEGSYHISVSFLCKDKWYCSICCMHIVCILLPTHPAVGTSVVPTLELLTML